MCEKCGVDDCIVCEGETPEPKHRCGYCDKELPESKMEQKEIWTNYHRVLMWFCKGKGCASYRQMGAEG